MKNNQTQSKTPATLIWAVDPTEPATKPLASNLRQLTDWLGQIGLEIQPVYVLKPTAADLEAGLLSRAESAQGKLERYVKSFSLKGMREPKIVIDEEMTRNSAAERLLRFASEQNTSCIAVSSHGRGGIGRIALGSFSESLLKAAKCPVLFLDHHTAGSAPIQHGQKAVFATDFSARSRRAYQDFLGMAAKLGCEVVLLHALLFPVTGEGIYIPETFFTERRQWAQRKAHRWMAMAKREGVKASFHLQDGGVGSMSGRAILEAASEHDAALVVLASNCGPMDRFLVGSPAYEAFRAHRFPVLVYGPGSLASATGALRTKVSEAAAATAHERN